MDIPQFSNEIPEAPPHIQEDERARALWNDIAGMMSDANFITRFDFGILADYVFVSLEIEDNVKALRKETRVNKSKRGGPTLNPRIRLVRDLIKQRESLSDRLGFSPTARGRVRTVDKQPTKPSENPKNTLALTLFHGAKIGNETQKS